MRYTCNLHAILAALGLGVGASLAAAQIAFTDVTNASGAGHFSESYGAAWGDLDGDGYPDLFTSNHRTKPSLFLNMGNGTFVDVAAQTLDWQNRQHADTHGASWADYNNDGAQDLMVSTGTGNLSQFLVNQHQRLVDLTVPLGLGLANLGGRLPVRLDYDKDRLLDVVVTQYGGVAKLFHQLSNGTFTEASTTVKLLCKRFHYGQLLDVNNDGQLDFVCPDEAMFPQKIYDPTKFPWKKLFDSTAPAAFFPLVANVADSAIADFNNDGRMDVFILSGVQLRPSSVIQGGPNNFEALLAGGSKGAKFVSDRCADHQDGLEQGGRRRRYRHHQNIDRRGRKTSDHDDLQPRPLRSHGGRPASRPDGRYGPAYTGDRLQHRDESVDDDGRDQA